MPSRKQVLDTLAGGHDYPEVARVLGISPRLAYLIAIGIPADGGDTATSAQREHPGP